MSQANEHGSRNIESHMIENRVFPPPEEFARRARIGSLAEYETRQAESLGDPAKFWAREAAELTWRQPWDSVLEWNCPEAKWFSGGRLNITENCLDRHLQGSRRDKPAIVWEGEPGDARTLTYAELHAEVCRFANVLKRHGIGAGDRVLLYLPLVPEAAVAMLACARIGAVHSVVFGGFSAASIKDRLADSGARMVVTADGGWRRGSIVPLKANVDAALADGSAGVDRVIVLRRTENAVEMQPERDTWWHEEMAAAPAECAAEAFESEHPLFILYTSGSTGRPKGILHTTAGYLLGTYCTTKYVFDLREDDVYWCTADVGWITGHSYVVYGPLANGATTFLYEGAPNHPEPDRWWKLIARHKISILYTAPTAIRAFIKWGDHWPESHDLSSLRLLGTVGEPINPEAWMWFREKIGGGRCPIVDTWWQTETGAHMITPLPGAIPTKPGTATRPFFGVDAAIVDDDGNEVGPNVGGKLVIRQPWPSMLRTIYGDPERYRQQYWSEFGDKGFYFTGDGARRDEAGNFWIVGRIDDVLNVAGHRLGTSEIESALVSHPGVAEAAVVGRPDEIKGQGVVAFVTLKADQKAGKDLEEALRRHVGQEIGAIAKPDQIRFADALPKTRSGKIMRRLLKEVASGKAVTGDTTTLEDLSILARLQAAED